MAWNWQQTDWPKFTWDEGRLADAERQFLMGGGILVGGLTHLEDEDRIQLIVDAMSTEAITTSEIEGEILNRSSVQSSIQRQLGLAVGKQRSGSKEQGIAEMMVNLYQTIREPLSSEVLFAWHRSLMAGTGSVLDVGQYRTSSEPMQVIFGPHHAARIHFEGPPAERVPSEMAEFIDWFNRSASPGQEYSNALTRAGTAHLYFESIHPFEDGNGRIGRAISEKALAQSLDQPVFISLAPTILSQRPAYYRSLELASRQNDITNWLAWFAGVAIESQRRTIATVELVIQKTKLFDALRGQLNPRQEKALVRMFREGPQGFKGGLSAANYATITGTTTATTTRDLFDLTQKRALVRTGDRKTARYHLPLPLQFSFKITICEDGSIREE